MRLREIAVERIQPDPGQPRKTFRRESLEGLAESIAEHGLLQPITVRVAGPARYMVVVGERRWRACQLLAARGQLTTMPCVVVAAPQRRRHLQLVENLQREDMPPLEEAVALKELVGAGHEPKELGRQLGGRTAEWVESRLRLLTLIPMAKEALRLGILPVPNAMLLAKLEPAQQHSVFLRWRDTADLPGKEFRRVCHALLSDANQSLLFAGAPVPGRQAVAAAGRFDQLLVHLESAVRAAVEPADAAIIASVLEGELGPRIRRLDLIIQEMCRIRRALYTASSAGRARALVIGGAS